MGAIKVIGSPLYQWELGRKIEITPPANTGVDKVEFSHAVDTEALQVIPKKESGKIIADLPNVMLQSGTPIFVYLTYTPGDSLETTASFVLPVIKRPKPTDYIYTETEVLTIERAIEKAVEEAKATGNFQGDPGYTPVRGTDYWTPEDKQEIVNETINSNEIQEAIESLETATDIAERAEAIAKGKATGYVFDTLEDMQLWLADEANTKLLNLGDNLYIRELNVPDYWWDGNAAQQLETQKVDLAGYMKAADYPTEKWSFTLADGSTVEKDVVIG